MYRISFLLIALAVICSCSTQPVNTKVLMYIGTTNNDSLKGIEYCFFDTVSGVISQPQLADSILNPNFLEVDSENGFLYAVGQRADKTSVVRSYKVDQTSGQVARHSEAVLNGKGPCYVALSKTSNELMLAFYGSGEVSAYKINNDELVYSERLSQLNRIQHYGSGPYENRQKGPHAHSIDVDPNSDFIYAADLGADKLMVYRMEANGLATVDSVIGKIGAGPRHFDFSPDGKMLAVLNELNCSVTTFAKDSKGIYKRELQTVTLLPDTFSGFAKAADIHFSPDGKFLYASNRGFDCIGIFKVNDMNIEFVEFVTEGILWPRNFAIDPSGNYLLVANRDLNHISVYKRNQMTGKLTMLPDVANVERPICIKFYK
ncbi:lactonase family protein [Saccharicrinis sp. 156]|uniref:lactonase family protein n=1 Tax=Saccharicrinis sp. 156 TaxID=3417574 RepID=UPI003D3282F6